jgi:hypothetical protein
VTGALVSGLAGYSLSLHQAAADGPSAKPIVRTEIRTVTIHRKAKPKAHPTQGPTTVVVRTAPSGSTHQASAVHHTGGSAHHGDDGDDGGDD